MNRSAFAEVFEVTDQNEIIIRCTNIQLLEKFFFQSSNLGIQAKGHSPFQLSLDGSNHRSLDVLWQILEYFCDDNWEPLGSAHHVFSAGYSTNSLRIYQFKKLISDPPYLSLDQKDELQES